jgi:hypothetical protein
MRYKIKQWYDVTNSIGLHRKPNNNNHNNHEHNHNDGQQKQLYHLLGFVLSKNNFFLSTSF